VVHRFVERKVRHRLACVPLVVFVRRVNAGDEFLVAPTLKACASSLMSSKTGSTRVRTRPPNCSNRGVNPFKDVFAPVRAVKSLHRNLPVFLRRHLLGSPHPFSSILPGRLGKVDFRKIYMSAKPDEFEAARKVVDVLEPFDNAERERIIRWSRDKLGMSGASTSVSVLQQTAPGITSTGASSPVSGQPLDMRTFIQQKNPRTDTQLAAAVAYFHRFVAPDSEKKDSIGKTDLLNACRLTERARPRRPDQTLVNAFSAGYFDKASRGLYKLNSVGENLVAVALPGAPGNSEAEPARPRPSGRKSPKKPKGKTAKRRARG
jgi:hypothetical protein